MGFFELKATRRPSSGKIKPEILFKHECAYCPLNSIRTNKHPHMEPTGSTKPAIYILGEAPGADEDQVGKQFVGKAGRTLRRRIPEEWENKIRWNNAVRTRPPKNRTPTPIELDCCRPSVARDIVATKPKAIFGFGGIPLGWALDETGITKWVNRRIPVRVTVPLDVGKYHDCWYFPMFHPSYVNRMKGEYGKDVELVFEKNLEWAFDSIDSLPEPNVHTVEDARADVTWVTGHGRTDLDRVISFLHDASKQKLLGLDYETNALRPYNKSAKILTVAIATAAEAFAFPLRHRGAGWSEQDVLTLDYHFSNLLYQFKGKIAVHNVAFEQEWSGKFYGKDAVRLPHWEDTISQAYILDERKGCLSLEFLALQYFGINIKQLAGLDRKNLDACPVEDVLKYNAIDAKYHRLLYQAQRDRLKDEGLTSVYREHMKRVPAAVLTQLKGLDVDQKQVQTLYAKYKSKSDAAEALIMSHKVVKRFERKTGTKFRISANHDMKKALAAFGCHPDAVDKVTLKQFHGGELGDFLKAVIDWREANKVISTYILPCIPGSETTAVFDDGKLHPIISTTKTTTWRTSSEAPNIQNWPKRNEWQKEVRKQIKPRKGPRGKRVIVSFDYGQIQARNVAMESHDKKLVDSFWKNYDIHADWRERIAKKCPDWMMGYKGLTSEQEKKDFLKAKRHGAKNGFVFPAFFGARQGKLSTLLGIGQDDARELLDEFLAEFSGIHSWHKRIERFYAAKGYVTGCTGFRRRAPITRNELINAPIQADEAAIVCDAWSRLSMMGKDAGMEIHDDLTFVWYESEVEKNAEKVIDTMLACPFEWANVVPISVEWAIGDDWYALKDQGAYSSDKWSGTLCQKKS